MSAIDTIKADLLSSADQGVFFTERDINPRQSKSYVDAYCSFMFRNADKVAIKAEDVDKLYHKARFRAFFKDGKDFFYDPNLYIKYQQRLKNDPLNSKSFTALIERRVIAFKQGSASEDQCSLLPGALIWMPVPEEISPSASPEITPPTSPAKSAPSTPVRGLQPVTPRLQDLGQRSANRLFFDEETDDEDLGLDLLLVPAVAVDENVVPSINETLDDEAPAPSVMRRSNLFPVLVFGATALGFVFLASRRAQMVANAADFLKQEQVPLHLAKLFMEGRKLSFLSFLRREVSPFNQS